MNERTIIFPNEGGGGRGGFDSDFLLGAMMGGGGGFGGFGGNWLLALLFFALWGGNGFGGGFGGGGGRGIGFLSNQLNDDAGRQLVLQAVQGNNTAIGQLSQTIGCSTAELRNAISAINNQLCNLGNQVGMSSMQIINAINSGDNALLGKLSECCCGLNSAIKDVVIGQERGFSSLGYASERQTCAIEKSIAGATEKILAGQRSAEMRELQREIAERDRMLAEKNVIINNAQQTQVFGQMIAQATTPILQAVGALQGDVNGIKCKLPNTVTLPYQEAQAVPNCVAYGLYGGFPGNGGGFFGL